jgi:general secretion pathway protein A
MYNEFFGLNKEPFRLTPDPEFLYLTPQHREALAGITYAIVGRKGFAVLTGDAGTGKTTLLTRVLSHLPTARVQSSVIINPTLSPAEFLESTLLDLGFEDIPASKAQRIVQLQAFLWKAHREGRITALIVDEAHKLSLEILEEIRLLGNFESAQEKLLQVVLVGQSELDELLDREPLRQFKQRIAMRLAIEPLKALDVERYIAHRWLKAGGARSPFTEDAITAIAQASRGIPRVINVICDNALIQAFGEGSARVEGRQVLTVARELRLIAPAPQPAPAVSQPVAVPQVRTAVATPPLPPPVNGAAAFEAHPFKTLERYNVAVPRRSLSARLLAKLKLMQKAETA